MNRKRPGRNEPCWCGSGLKYKKCHEGMEEGRFPFPLPGAPGVMVNDLKVKASFVEAEASSLPGYLLRLARHAAGTAQSNRDVLLALLLVTTAGEAVVNRLLEPLIPEEEWDGIERESVAEKWKRLYREVGANPLAKDQAPLSDYLVVAGLRNALVHFKHGRNTWCREQPIAASWEKGTVHLGGPIQDAAEQVPDVNWRDILEPSAAPSYFEALRTLLSPVLELHPNDAFKIVDDLKAALTEPLPGTS